MLNYDILLTFSYRSKCIFFSSVQDKISRKTKLRYINKVLKNKSFMSNFKPLRLW